MMTNISSKKPQDTLSLLKTDFKMFLQALWSQLDLPSPTRAQYAIADYLQHGPKRLQIQAFRGVGKSWITGAFVLWTLFNDPERKVMIISASKERADNMSIFLQKLIIETPWLNYMQPSDRDNARWSRISFDINCSPHQAPSVKSVGITGQLTGSRADLMILDDIEVPGNSMTELMREKLLQLCTEAESILTPKEDSRICYLGTPQTSFTVYRKLAERSYKPFVWTARIPKSLSNYEGTLAPQLTEDIDNGAVAGSVTDPDRFDHDDLLDREVSMGRSNFQLQFMLDTTLSDSEKFPLKNADLIVTAVNPSLAPDSMVGQLIQQTSLKTLPLSVYLEIISTAQCESQRVNGSLTQRQSAQLIHRVEDQMRQQQLYISQRNGFLYLHEMRAYRSGYTDDTLLDILRGCKKYKATTLLIESNFGDGIVSELFRKHLQQTKQAINIEEVRANVRKEDRIIDSLEPVLNQHRLIVNRSVIDWDYKSNQDQPPEERLMYMLFYQMSRMCREKGAVRHDDRLDCLAQGIKWFTDALAISAQENINMEKREEWNDMLESWADDPQAAANHLAFWL